MFGLDECLNLNTVLHSVRGPPKTRRKVPEIQTVPDLQQADDQRLSDNQLSQDHQPAHSLPANFTLTNL